MNKSTIVSGAQGISGRRVKIGSMYSSGGSQTITASEEAEVKILDNRIEKEKISLPFSRVRDFTLFGNLLGFELPFILHLKKFLGIHSATSNTTKP
jgi:hypothetical protein